MKKKDHILERRMEEKDVLDYGEEDVLDHGGGGCARPWRRRMC